MHVLQIKVHFSTLVTSNCSALSSFVWVIFTCLWICTGNMRNWKEQDHKQQILQVLRHLLQCIKCWECHGRELEKVLDNIVTCYTRTHEHNLFALLSDLAISPNHTYIYRYYYFIACGCFYHHILIVSGAPSHLYSGYFGCFPVVNWQIKFTTSLHVIPGLRIHGTFSKYSMGLSNYDAASMSVKLSQPRLIHFIMKIYTWLKNKICICENIITW